MNDFTIRSDMENYIYGEDNKGKLTDNEIIKALERCTSYPACPTDCPLYEQPMDCLFKLSKPTLDLINRQQAENERLQKLLDDKCDRCIAKERAEAVKEFAARLKECKHECGCNYRKKPVYAVTEEKIDNLLKEKVGEDNA